MGIISDFMGGVLNPILDKFIPDANVREQIKAAVAGQGHELELTSLQGQLETNKLEAQHPSVFVAGWRPALGWVGVLVMGLVALGYILWPVIATAFGVPVLVAPDWTLVGMYFSLVMGMAGLRGWETFKGVERERIKPPRAKPYTGK